MLPMPVGTMGVDEIEVEVPSIVKESYAKFWWALLVLLVGVATLDILAGDVFGVIFMALMAFVVWYMVANKCKQMSQYCLMLFGLMCVIEAVFESITLLMMLSGRSIQHRTVSTAISPDGVQRTQTITTVEEMHPFFDKLMGTRYNLQSVAKVASPACMMFGGALAYWTYSAFPVGLFAAAAAADEAGPFYGAGGLVGGSYGGASASPAQLGRATMPAGARRSSNVHGLFEGSGQRLGS